MPLKVEEKLSIEEEELRGISRTVAEIEWMLLILILLYQLYGNPDSDGQIAISMALFFYAAFIMSFRYANFYKVESRWKIALESSGMLVFITWSLWFTGKLESPLLNTYLLVIITSALTQGRYISLAFLSVITVCFFFLGNPTAQDFYSISYATGILSQLAPFVLVTYITTMFSSDIRYSLNKAKVMSEMDGLTGILNRHGFAITASRLHGQAIRYNRPLSVIMIDSDNLKEVNDSLGHKAGDDLLILLVKNIQNQLRDTDIFARFGGDEFIALLPETSEQSAIEVAERICKSIANTPLGVGSKSIKITVSIGVTSIPNGGQSLDSLVDSADKAMYQAKKQGRDRVVKFSNLT